MTGPLETLPISWWCNDESGTLDYSGGFAT